MPDRPAPLVVLGVDGLEQRLVDVGVREGWLPTLARLLADGRSARLSPPDREFPGATWPTTVTGARAHEHGLLLDRRLEPGSYTVIHATADDAERPPFWRWISDAGIPSTVASIYSAPFLQRFRGSQVIGWGNADPYSEKLEGARSDPPELVRRLERAVGRRNLVYHLREPYPDSIEEIRRYRDRRLRGIEQQTRGLALLLAETEWAFFLASYSEAHPAGHLMWHRSDPEHPEHDPDAPADVRGLMRSLYEAIDAGIGELLGRCPPEARVLVLTPHGMRANSAVGPLLPAILERAGWLVRRPAEPTRRSPARLLLSRARRAVPAPLQPALGRLLTRVRDPSALGMALSDVEWAETQAFVAPHDDVGYVRVNLAGREPAGTVAPGEAYERLLDSIVETLEGLVDARSGRPATERVVRTEDVTGPPLRGDFPDICVMWAEHGPLTRLESPTLGTIEIERDDPRTGQHGPTGFVVGAGPGIPASRSDRIEDAEASLLDVAPTMLSLLGVPAPALLGGRPIDAFRSPDG